MAEGLELVDEVSLAGCEAVGEPGGDELEAGLFAGEVGARQAIVTTTRDNARVLRLADKVGTIEPGKVADLIAVNVDPLERPDALADPVTVTLVMQGRQLRKGFR